jgi:beta-glucanase (GH16 family)
LEPRFGPDAAFAAVNVRARDRARAARSLALVANLLAAAACGPSSGDTPRAPGAAAGGDDGSSPPNKDASLVDGAESGPDAAAGAHDASATGPGEAGSEAGAASEAGIGSDAAPGGDGGGAGPEQCVNRAAVASKWKLVWSDEFDKDGAPDPTNWGFEHGFVRNQELQWYQPDNATVSGGLLTIAARKEQVANPNYNASSSDWKLNRQYAQYTSSSLTSSGKRSYQYGRFEMCGQIDTRQGSWPAFWVLGNGRSWPSSGEVDIMEYYANNVRANVCKPSGSTCDWSGSVAQPLSKLGGSTWAAEFHLWAMEWSSTDINLYLDDALVYDFKVSSTSASKTAYQGNPFYILLDLAIGANGGDPSNTTFPITYKVDYVRVYQ